MLHLTLALSSFLVLHLMPVVPGMREGIVNRIGRRPYILVHSSISTLALVWVIVATLQAPTVLLWPMDGWQAWVPVTLTPLALFLVLAGLLSPNPLSLTIRHGDVGSQSGIVRITRHPVFWGALIWAVSHLVPNGDLRSVLLFGSMAALAVAGFGLGDRRAKRKLGAQWEKLAAKTSIVPFLAIAQTRTHLKIDGPMIFAALLATLVTGWLLVGGHAALFGVDPLAATAY